MESRERTTSLIARKGAQVVLAIALCASAAFLPGCAGVLGAAGAAPSGAAFVQPTSLTMPVVSADAPQIDTSHVSDGYVVVHAQDDARLKFQVSKGDAVYNYDLPNTGEPTVFSLNMDSGTYLFRIMKNTDANNYVEIDSTQADVQLSSEFAPYIIPNQFCNYDENSECVALARELTADATNQGEAVEKVCDYIIEHIDYDTEKAALLTTITGYIPNPDETLASQSGVCFDYASLGAAMLRSLGLPTKIITGYVSPGDLYHAWIMVYIDGTWQTGEFSVNPETWSRVDLTFAASGSTEFTGDGTNYTERYVY